MKDEYEILVLFC